MIFQLSNSENIIYAIELDGTVRCVPKDQANSHYQAYQQWLTDGNEPLPAED